MARIGKALAPTVIKLMLIYKFVSLAIALYIVILFLNTSAISKEFRDLNITKYRL
ncbi:hypothetical protein LDL76_15915 [Salegentibacter mishustinae]|uniref:hypothetical protein n=1 Tax=Salegentibacter mishustinae TaxID=270918 RepID=UPI000DB1E9BB|nr:hypothetical protein [Salegentibacter mishustinae]PZX65094.1 hypothetical protein LY54_01387 [Salegentibacter mishustinae]UBZ06828.1 hypothetical protein LDL76_15915 [Salegentibacter mishustinae]GGW87363.1 hypothetical protein GCM10008086_14880 [Salegentibacter mishustinae]